MTPYNHTTQLLAAKALTSESELVLVLLSPDATINPAHTSLAEVGNLGTWEVNGGGWPATGYPISNLAVSLVDTNVTEITGDGVSLMPSATSDLIRYAVLCLASETGSPPVGMHDFGQDFSIVESFQFELNWVSGYILRLSNAAP